MVAVASSKASAFSRLRWGGVFGEPGRSLCRVGSTEALERRSGVQLQTAMSPIGAAMQSASKAGERSAARRALRPVGQDLAWWSRIQERGKGDVWMGRCERGGAWDEERNMQGKVARSARAGREGRVTLSRRRCPCRSGRRRPLRAARARVGQPSPLVNVQRPNPKRHRGTNRQSRRSAAEMPDYRRAAERRATLRALTASAQLKPAAEGPRWRWSVSRQALESRVCLQVENRPPAVSLGSYVYEASGGSDGLVDSGVTLAFFIFGEGIIGEAAWCVVDKKGLVSCSHARPKADH